MSKKTLVLGASEKPDRYANIATRRLQQHDHEVVAVGFKPGEINGTPIVTEFPVNDDSIDTVTLYLSPKNQKQYYDQLLALKPRRVIFNPGTENSELQQLLQQNGIETEIACTLVLLSTGGY